MHRMARRRPTRMLILLASLVAGCTVRAPTPLAPPPSSSQVWSAQAATPPEAGEPLTTQAARVHEVARRLKDRNPQIASLRSAFVVPRSPRPELSHREDGCISISEGLVDQCRTDGELAALLSLELAEILLAREARRNPLNLPLDREPPPQVPIGRDGGSFGDADQIHKAEVAKLGYDRRKPPLPSSSLDPQVLARQVLTNAGYAESNLAVAAPLRHAAARGPE